jgi:replicative DNA helicase
MMAANPQDPPEVAGLPHNIEAEAALLGALMIDNRLVERVADRLQPEHFFEPLHGRIYSALVREVSFNRTANPVTLKPYFVDDQAMKEVGGPAYLAQLTGSGAAVIGARDFAAQVLELAQLRAMVGVGREIAAKAGDTSEELGFANVVAFAEEQISLVSQEAEDGCIEVSAAEAADRAMKAGEDSHQRGVTSGITPIDEALGPIRRKQLIIMGARPGMGKSATASGYSIGAAEKGHGVLFFSLEMSDEEIGARMLSDVTFQYDGQGVPYGLIETGQLNMPQIRRLMEAKDHLATLPLQIIDIGQSSTGKLNAMVRRWKRRFAARGQSLELVVVDYIQKLRPNHRTKDRYEAITEVSQDLKTLAKVHNVGVLGLAQLSRGVEQRQDHRPQLSDLRDSGQIEQDADGVLFLYRQQYYLEAGEPPDDGSDARLKWERALDLCKNRIEFICAKRRQGRTGKRIGEFHGAFSAVRASDA